MTDLEYRRLSRYGRLVYCPACRETEPPRVIRRGTIVVMPESWLSLLG